jgi:hypothetical protein
VGPKLYDVPAAGEDALPELLEDGTVGVLLRILWFFGIILSFRASDGFSLQPLPVSCTPYFLP